MAIVSVLVIGIVLILPAGLSQAHAAEKVLPANPDITAIAAVFLLIALGLILWTVSLRRKVALRTKNLVVEIQERKQAEEALVESELKHRTLFTHMGQGFYLSQILYDENGIPCDFIYIDINPAFEKITGLKR
jgi:PAS domain-containing protein